MPGIGLKTKVGWREVALVIASLVLSSVLLEMTLRLLGFPATPVRVANPPNFSETRRNLEFQYHFATNSRGLRSREIPLRKEAGRRRVFVVGDSFTEGTGVEADQTFTALLEQSLAQGGHPADFINAGLAGTGPDQYARVFFGVGLTYHPDGLLICLYQNDVANMPEALIPAELHPEAWSPSSRLKRLVYRLYPRLYVLQGRIRDTLAKPGKVDLDLVTVVSQRARDLGISGDRIAGWKAALPSELVQAADQGKINGALLSYPLLRPWYCTDALDIDTPRAEREWQSMVVALGEMVRVARLHHIAVGVLYLPAPYQYDPAEFRADNLQRRLGMILREEWLKGPAEVQLRLAAWATTEQVPFLDLTGAFREQLRPGQRLNWTLDGHWKPEGHQIAARVIRDWIFQANVFPFLSSPH